MSRYDDVLARLRAATGRDRALDAEIDCLLRYTVLRPAKNGDHAGRFDPVSAGDIWCPTGFLMAHSNTDSVDASLALVKDRIHHVTWTLSNGPGKFGCLLGGIYASAPTLPLAILIALFEALKTREAAT